MKRLILLITLLLVSLIPPASATTFYSIASGNLNVAATWSSSCGGVAGSTTPTSSDDVVICTGDTVKLVANTQLQTITINAGGVFDNNTKNLSLAKILPWVSSNLLFTIEGEYTGSGTTTFLSPGGKLAGYGLASTTGDWTFYNGTIDTLTNITFTNSNILTSAGNPLYCYGSITLTNGNLNLNIASYNYGDITITNGDFITQGNIVFRNYGTLTIGGNITTSFINSTIYNYGTGIFNLAGNFINTGGNIVKLNASTAGNIVNYNGSGSQTVRTPVSSIYQNLKCSNADTKTMAANLIIKGDLTIRDAAQLDASASPYNIDLKGHWYDSSTATDPFVERTGTVAFSDTGAQTISEGTVAETFYNLTISNGGIKTLNKDIIINGDLTIQDTAQLDVTATPHNISLGGSWINTGTNADPFLERTGRVTFIGASSQTITSDAVPAGGTFYDLTVSNTSGDISLSNNVTVDANLNFTTGKIILGTNNLVLSTPTAITGYSSSGYVVTDNTGYLQINDITSAFWFPVGISTTSYTPANINNNGSGADATDFSVRVADTVLSFQGNVQVDNIVDRTWYITSTGGTANASLTLQWNAAEELGAFDRTNCGISHYSEPTWDVPPVFSAASGSGPYTQTRTGISAFSPFAVEGLSHPLPIELLNFTGTLNNEGQVLLSWTTATEINNDFFTVERGIPSVLRTSPPFGGETLGINFVPVGIVKGAGNSTAPLNYRFADGSPLSFGEGPGERYYRLKQTDYDGKCSYSNIVAVTLPNDLSFEIYPNPATDHVILKIPAKEEAKSILVIDIFGRTIINKIEDMEKGVNSFTLDLSGLSNGVYLLQTMTASGHEQQKKFMIHKQ